VTETADFAEILHEGLKELSFPVDNRIISQFETYKRELVEWNRRIDITSIATDEDMAIKHFIDSLLPSVFIKNGAFVMDIGSGGGFPGIPLKIYKPDLRMILLEASEKKVVFLKHIIRILGLKNITPINQRAEDKGFRTVMKETVDVVLSRAFSRFKDFFDIARHYVRPGGMVIGMLGREWERAIQEADSLIKTYGFEVKITRHFELPRQKGQRTIIGVVRK